MRTLWEGQLTHLSPSVTGCGKQVHYCFVDEEQESDPDRRDMTVMLVPLHRLERPTASVRVDDFRECAQG